MEKSPQNINKYSKIIPDIIGCIKDLKEEESPITDGNQSLQRLCAKIEFLLQSGMKVRSSRLTGTKKDYWDMICECVGTVKGLSDGLKWVKSCSENKTALGKGRALVRFSLVHHRLADTLQHCIMCGQALSAWYEPHSVWLNFELRSPLISALYDLNDIIFDLSPHGHDLDNVWPSFARGGMSMHGWKMRSRTSSFSSLHSLPNTDSISINPFDLSILSDVRPMNGAESVYSPARPTDPETNCKDVADQEILKSDITELKQKLDESLQAMDSFKDFKAFTKGEEDAGLDSYLQYNETNHDSELSLRLNELNAELRQLQDENAGLRENNRRLVIDRDQGLEELTSARAECSNHKERATSLEVGSNDLRQCLRVLEADLEKSKSELSASERESCGLSDEVARLANEKCVLQTDVEQLEDDNMAITARCDALMNGNADLLGQLRDLRELAAVDRHAMEREIEELKAESGERLERQLRVESELEKVRVSEGGLRRVVDGWAEEWASVGSELDAMNRNILLRGTAESHALLGSDEGQLEPDEGQLESDDGQRDSGVVTTEVPCGNHSDAICAGQIYCVPEVSLLLNNEAPELVPEKRVISKVRALIKSCSKLSQDKKKVAEYNVTSNGDNKHSRNQQLVELEQRNSELEINMQKKDMEISELLESVENLESSLREYADKTKERERYISELESDIDEQTTTVRENEAISELRIEEREERIRQLLLDQARLVKNIELLVSCICQIREDMEELPKSGVIEKLTTRVKAMDGCEELRASILGRTRDSVEYIDEAMVDPGLGGEGFDEGGFGNDSAGMDETGDRRRRRSSILGMFESVKASLSGSDGIFGDDLSEVDGEVFGDGVEINNVKGEEPLKSGEVESDEVIVSNEVGGEEVMFEDSVILRIVVDSDCELTTDAEVEVRDESKHADEVTGNEEVICIEDEVGGHDFPVESGIEVKGEARGCDIGDTTDIDDNTDAIETESRLEETCEGIKMDDQAFKDCTLTDKTSVGDTYNQEGEDRTKYKDQIDSLASEISGLKFELSSAQMQQQIAYSNFDSQQEDIIAMVRRLTNQQELIDGLEVEMRDIKEARGCEKACQNNELEQMKAALLIKEDERVKAIIRREENEFDEERKKYELTVSEKANELATLEDDMVQLKRKLVKLIREKDALWHRTDSLVHEKRLQAAEKWMSDTDVVYCMGCRAEFSFTVRRHHCRLCGKIYCFLCCNNWIMTTHSSKKSRVCNSCYVRHGDVKHGIDCLDESGDEDTETEAEGTGGERNDGGKKVASMEDGTVSTGGSLPSTPCVGTDVSLSASPSPSDVKVATPSAQGSGPPVKRAGNGWNETDDNKYTRLAMSRDPETSDAENPVKCAHPVVKPAIQSLAVQSPRPIPGAVQSAAATHARCKYDEFDVISDEEIARSLTLSGSYHGAESSVIISAELLSQGTITSTVTIAPGNTFSLPIAVITPGDMLCWQFTSQPKDVGFGAIYSKDDVTPPEEALVLVSQCRCNAHKQLVKGELTAKKAGIYTLQFDNTISKLTSKRVEYSLYAERAV